MQTLRFGDKGLYVRYLQAALLRAGEEPGSIDGIFGRRTERALTGFQNRFGLRTDGVAGRLTRAALYPFLTGAAVSILREGETVNDLADRFGTTPGRIRTANPSAAWTKGEQIVVPLGFDVVFTDVPYSAFLTACVLEGLTLRYPYLVRFPIGASVTGKRIEAVRIGAGPLRVGVNAAHHANEWITAPLLLRFVETLCAAYAAGDGVFGYGARDLLAAVTLTAAPMVNPDGVDLVVGALTEGPYFEAARRFAGDYPAIPFPAGWKANLQGVDPNLQYPALWERAREIKFAQGYTTPGPRDYVGPSPLSAPESRALWELTRTLDPALTISWHTQGGVIYWKYLDIEPEGAEAIGRRFAAASGYALADAPYESGFAGFKDWFIGAYGRPGYTVEAGRGENPLPVSDFESLWRENLGILTLGMALAGGE